MKKQHKREDNLNFSEGTHKEIRFYSSIVKFAKLYNKEATIKRYLIAIAVGILMGFFVQIFVKNTGLYNSGMSALIQGLSRIIYVTMTVKNVDSNVSSLVFNLIFWVLYFLVNVPLFIFSYKSIGKTFTKLTLIFLLANTASGFAFSYIPGIDNVLLFGDSIISGGVLRDNNVYTIPFHTNEPLGNKPDGSAVINDEESIKAFFLLAYAFVYGLVCAFFYSLLYIIDACSAGMDFVSIYYSIKKNKSLGSTLFIINSASMILGATMGSYISGIIVDTRFSGFEFFFSANLVMSFISVFVFNAILVKFFPSNKSIRVEIYSKKINEIRDSLFANNYTHTLTIYKTIGAYSLKDQQMMVTICLYAELPKLVKNIRKVDPDCLIVTSHTADIDGMMRVYQQGSSK